MYPKSESDFESIIELSEILNIDFPPHTAPLQLSDIKIHFSERKLKKQQYQYFFFLKDI